jgi:hypothetical protein
MLTFAADSWHALVRCVGEHSANVAGRLLSAPCPLRDRFSRDAPLLYYARLEPSNFSR